MALSHLALIWEIDGFRCEAVHLFYGGDGEGMPVTAEVGLWVVGKKEKRKQTLSQIEGTQS